MHNIRYSWTLRQMWIRLLDLAFSTGLQIISQSMHSVRKEITCRRAPTCTAPKVHMYPATLHVHVYSTKMLLIVRIELWLIAGHHLVVPYAAEGIMKFIHVQHVYEDSVNSSYMHSSFFRCSINICQVHVHIGLVIKVINSFRIQFIFLIQLRSIIRLSIHIQYVICTTWSFA